MSVLVNVTSGGFGCAWSTEIRRADTNGLVGSVGSCGSVGFLEPVTLPVDGTYLVVANPVRSSTGSAAVHLYDVADITTPITTDGTPVPVDLTFPGRNTRLPFSGLAGQRMSVWVNVTGGGFGCAWYTEIRRADTNALVGNSVGSCGTAAFLEPVTLPVDGDYVVVVNPQGSSGGTATVRLYHIVDVTEPISDGSPVAVTLTRPGQNALLTFAGTQGQRVSALVNVTGGSFWCWYVRILKPDGTELGNAGSCNASAFREPLVLPANGVYTVKVDPGTSDTGSFQVRLYDVPPDVTGTLTINATPVPVSLSVPGQNAQFTFDGTQGQQVTVRLTGNTMSTTYVRLRRPDGSQTSTGSWYTNFNMASQTLPASGTYTMIIDPYVTNTGSISVQVTSP